MRAITAPASDRYPRLRLIADRGQHEAAVFCRAIYRSDQLAARGGAGGHRGRATRTKELTCMTEVTASLLALFVIVVIPAVIITTHRDINRGLNRAVEIAQHQGWVSPHRLITQAGVKNADAQLILSRACKQGVLFQAVDGRYYLPGGRAKPNAPIAMVGIVPQRDRQHAEADPSSR